MKFVRDISLEISSNMFKNVHGTCKEAWLIGQTIAFYNPWRQRFMQMASVAWGQLTTSAQVPSGELCNECTTDAWLSG